MTRARATRPARLRRALGATALTVASALTLTACDFSIYDMPLPGGADVGDDPYEVHVKFRDVLDLVPHSTVKLNDVTIGKVTDVSLDGYAADVLVQIRRDVELPENTYAEIRQTSLLGEKFVSLSAPEEGATGQLEDGETIPLERTGRNPEVEEVLGAMSLLLNGGGVAQLKTIASELNKALGGREDEVKSMLRTLNVFMGQLNANRTQIVDALESVNNLAIELNRQTPALQLALDELPEGIDAVNAQREDMVRMLRALARLSSIGTEVIQASKQSTISSLRDLVPILTRLRESGDNLPNALSVFLTYPFVDEVVGRNPAQARSLHFGDYVNLSVQMDVDYSQRSGDGGGGGDNPLEPPLTDVQRCLESGNPNSPACEDLGPRQIRRLCKQAPTNPLCEQAGGGLPLPDNPLPLPRAAVGAAGGDPLRAGSDLGYLLLWGVTGR